MSTNNLKPGFFYMFSIENKSSVNHEQVEEAFLTIFKFMKDNKIMHDDWFYTDDEGRHFHASVMTSSFDEEKE